jgi:hypothetical protein
MVVGHLEKETGHHEHGVNQRDTLIPSNRAASAGWGRGSGEENWSGEHLQRLEHRK